MNNDSNASCINRTILGELEHIVPHGASHINRPSTTVSRLSVPQLSFPQFQCNILKSKDDV